MNKKLLYFTLSLLCLFTLFVNSVFAGVWTVNNQSKFDEGTYNNTESDINSVKIKEWSDTEKELPHDGITDQWGIDMSGNVLLMHMNESSGTIMDNSGAVNDGIYNSTLYSQSGKLNTSIGFDGDGDSINIGNDSSLNLVSDLTISTWLKPTAYVNDGVILGKPHTSQANPYVTYALGYSSNGRNYGLALGDGTAQRGCYTDSNTVVLDEWTYITATFNGTQIHLYINGELNKTCSFSYFEINQNTVDVLLGDYPYFGSTYDYAGNMDELAIFSRVLTAQEIEDIYHRQTNKFGGDNPGDYYSKVLNSIGNSKWESISWTTEVPYGQELSNNQAIETGDFIHGMDMTGNIGLWHMDETSGSIIDSSGNDNNGTVNGGVNYNEDGKLNKALGFNGIDGYVEIPNHASLNPTTAITTMAWVKWDIDPATSVHQWAAILNKNADNQYRLQHNQLNTGFEFGIRTSEGSRWATGSTIPQQDVWYFVVGTWDGSVVRLYVNGVLEGSANRGGTMLTSTSNVNIGRRTSNDRFFNGKIDEVAIFNRALSAQEVEDIYKRGVLKFGLSVRSCDDSNCSGEAWTDLGYSLTSPQNLTVVDNQYFQYKFDFETDDTDFTPQLYDVTVEYNVSPDVPTNTTPADVAHNIELNPNLFASVFSDPESDNHMDTEWRVDNDSDFSSPVWSRTAGIGETQTAINNVNGTFANELTGKNELDYETTYYWQVRYKDDGSNNWSNWSTSTSFTTLNLYTIAYDSNEAISGSAPANQIKTHGIDLILRSNTGSLSKTAHDFTGWNTATDGSGTHYAEGANFTTDANTTLYAEWTLGVCPVVANAATYNVYPICGPATCNSGYRVSGGSCVATGGGGGLPSNSYINPKTSLTEGQIIINNNDENTESQKVKITLNYSSFSPKINGYALSNDPKFAFASIDKIENYEKNGRVWDLCSGKNNSCPAGPYTVYIKFYTQWGRTSDVFQDTINLITKKEETSPKTEIDSSECKVPKYLTNPIIFGTDNNPEDVKLLEIFLNTYEGYNLPVDGIYSEEDRDAVIKWQEKYADEILKPWGLTRGTGYVYNTSLKKIKQIYESLCKNNKEEPSSQKYIFTRDLYTGITGEDVRELQKYLNKNGFVLTTEGPGSPENETERFGALTRNALIKFQLANGISPAVGYFGPITRGVVNN
jgi:hypothetical protein